MTIRRLIPVLLVLLQSGLAAGHAHAHPDLAGHSDAPHLHAPDLLDLFLPDHADHDHDGDDHDADAVDLSDLTVAPAPPPVFDTIACDLAPVDAGLSVAGCFGPPPAPLGLPPPTAGPSTPRYITFCTLTI